MNGATATSMKNARNAIAFTVPMLAPKGSVSACPAAFSVLGHTESSVGMSIVPVATVITWIASSTT